VQAQELKVGYVDLAEVFDNYQRTKASDAALEKRGKQKEAELEGRMSELKKLRQNLELLSDDSREAKQREIEEKSEELQRFRTSTARDLRRERDKIAKEILGEIQQGIDEYAKANGFSLIVDERLLLYGQSAYDLTDEILKLLNGHVAAAQSQ
jgi:outer membrane protein